MNTTRPRSPGIVYGTVVFLLVVLLAALALTSRQPPPPTIAEFAPQAIEQIRDESVTSRSTASAGMPTPTPAPEESVAVGADAIDVARVRRCVGDPPRQIEDPQSPPCVPYWSGDNGGATYKGITREEIRIVETHRDGGGVGIGFTNALEKFFNARFEFYGRKLRFLTTKSALGATPESQRAVAAEADEQLHAFGSTGDGIAYYYADDLARRGLISTTGDSTSLQESHMAELHPYEWMYMLPVDQVMLDLGDWTCARLARSRARFAGQPLLAQSERRFGAVYSKAFADDPTTLAPLESALARCGVRLEAKAQFNNIGRPNGQAQTDWTNAVLQMKSRDVTTVLLIVNYPELQNAHSTATTQQYFPEWAITSFGFADSNAFVQFAGQQKPDQLKSTFGLTTLPKQLPLQDSPVYWAVNETRPDFQWGDQKQKQPLGWQFQYAKLWYWQLLTMASGIQMAGPHLTPQTFARGLQQTRFPYPANDPLYAGPLRFDGDHSGVQESAQIWWSNTGRSPNPDDGPGAYCYVDHGTRHLRGDWSKGDAGLFESPCDSGAG